jgi:uncharacterized membrane protein YkvA (DUF1232 family)
MKNFDQFIQEEVQSYSGQNERFLHQAPALYRLMTRLLDDPNLPGQLRPLVITAIAYFILPEDIMPEDLKGPYGYVDDVFFCAFIAQQIRKELDSDEILTVNWDGSGPILALIEDILAAETDLIGDRRDLILWYVGFDYLLSK